MNKGFILPIWLLIAVLVIIGAIVFFFLYKKPTLPQPNSTQTSNSDSYLQEKYENPFTEESQYKNPFSEGSSEYQNPFANLE